MRPHAARMQVGNDASIKGSLSFILAFFLRTLGCFGYCHYKREKKHFTAHFPLCLCCFVGQSAIRIDICGFRGNIKDNKKLYPYSQTRCKISTKATSIRPTRERKRFCFEAANELLRAWHVTFLQSPKGPDVPQQWSLDLVVGDLCWVTEAGRASCVGRCLTKCGKSKSDFGCANATM